MTERKIKILLATDFSEAVMNAERYAVQLACYMNAELTVIHAAESTYNAVTDTLSDTKRSKAAAMKSIQEEVSLRCEQIRIAMKLQKEELTIRCIAKEGQPCAVVCSTAEDMNTDIIIVGTHGRSGFRSVLYGTHAWKIIRTAKRPVIAVPEEGIFTGLERIVFATEQRRGEVVSLRSIIRLIELFRPAITVLNISRRLLAKAETLKKIETIRRQISGSIDYGRIDIQVVHAEKIIAGLNKFCNSEKADLLVMSPRGLSGVVKFSPLTGNIAKKMSFHTRTPLLIVPDYYLRSLPAISGEVEEEDLF